MLGEPVETFVKSISTDGAGALDEPGSSTDFVKAESGRDFSARHGAGEILLVGEDEEDSVLKLFLSEHLMELFLVLVDTVAIVRVDDENESLGVLVVMSPEESDLILTTDIPDVETDVLVLNSLDVEANSGDGVDDLSELELVEDSGLTGSIETDHEDSHFFVGDHTVPKFVE